MSIREILHSKGNTVHTIAPTAMLADAVRLMVDFRCGSLIVCNGEQMMGIISERDILRTLVEVDAPLESTPVSTRMSTQLIIGSPDDDLASVMGTMTKNRIRHLPVVSDGRLAGVVSIGDIVKAQHEQLTRENHFLLSYIQS